MQKRKALDSGCQSEQKKHLTEKDKHIQNAVDAMLIDMGGMETNITACIVTSNTNMEDTKNKDLHTSLEPTCTAIIIKKEDILRSTGSHPEKKYDVATTVDACLTEVKTTCSQKTKCAHHNGKTKSTNISPDEDVPNPLLQDVQGLFSADVLALPSTGERDIIGKTNNEESFSDIPNRLVNKEGDHLSETAEVVVLKQSDVTPDTYLSSSDAVITDSKEYKSYIRRAKNKYFVSSSVIHPLLPGAQGCTSGNTSSLSSFSEKGSLRKTTDETSIEDNFTPSVEKENGALMGSACASSDESCISPDFRSESVVMESISDLHKEKETKKKEFLDSQCKLSCDPAATSPSLSGAVILDLAGMKASTENATLNLDTEDWGTTKSTYDIPNTQSTISFHVASNSHQAAEYCSIPTEVAQEKEPSKVLSFSSCDIELVQAGSSDAALQIMDGTIARNSEKGSASEEVQKSRDKEVNHAIHEQDASNDAVALLNEDLADESDKAPEASGISAEGSLKAFSSPIRGVIHDFTSLAESNEKNLLNSFKKEEVSFSFQTGEKLLTDESSDNHSEKACCGVGSNNVLPNIGKNYILDTMSSCSVSGITNGLENEVYALSMSHGTGNNYTSDLINFQDKKSEAVILQPERNLASCRRKKLLVLDLNGLLADIVLDIRNVHKAQNKVGGKSVYKRPFCDDFLKFCFETFDIGVWSSRRKYNVDSVLDFIMGDSRHKLLFCWDQSHCTYTGVRTLENVHKPLVLKELKKLWYKEETDLPWELGDYSPSNTLLVDDSPYKALCNPPNTAIFPYPYRFDDENDTSLGPGGDLRVYLEGLSVADDVQLYVQEHPFGQQAITNSDPSWNFYLQVIEKVEQSLAPKR